MRIDPQDAIREIDEVLATQAGGRDWSADHEIAALLEACIARLAPPGSSYARRLAELPSIHAAPPSEVIDRLNHVTGSLRALRSDYAAGRMRSFEELVHASLFADLLEQGDHLSEAGFHQAAIVLVGCTLEEHLRKLGAKNNVPITTPDGKWKKASALNIDLAKAAVYLKTEQAYVDACLKDRNDAAHPAPPAGTAPQFDRAMVERLRRSVTDFLARHPA